MEQGELILKDESLIVKPVTKELQLLTAKSTIYVFNIAGQPSTSPPEREIKAPHVHLDLKLESDSSELSKEEQKELELPPSQLNQLIKTCYQALDLITFYTITGGQETRAWTLKKGSAVPQAGGVVHSDFEEKFIRAEVISWPQLIEAGSWLAAREKGLLRTEGKEYIVQDGDVIEFKI